MTSDRAITIVGGGLAGLSLGIMLRRTNVPVTIWEAGIYPRHRVCGEFISGRGIEVLRRTGLEATVRRARTREALTCRFAVGRMTGPVRKLPVPALCVSRYELDAALAREFENAGGRLHTGKRWTGNFSQAGVVRSTGRKAANGSNSQHCFGLKIHAKNALVNADLEMVASSLGYLGICRLPDGVMNVCGLFRRSAGTAANRNPEELLRAVAGEALDGVEFEPESRCSVAGLSFGRMTKTATLAEPQLCSVGDSWTMTPPVTGNGMSMAFESAELAAGPLLAWHEGRAGWDGTCVAIGTAHEQRFRNRLRWAAVLQWLMFVPVFRAWPGQLALNSEPLWRMLFERTR